MGYFEQQILTNPHLLGFCLSTFEVVSWWLFETSLLLKQSRETSTHSNPLTSTHSGLIDDIKVSLHNVVTWCGLWCCDCFFGWWNQHIMYPLMKHNILLWLACFQQLWLVHFNPCCFDVLFPRGSAAVWLSCCCVSWIWASTLGEFLFYYLQIVGHWVDQSGDTLVDAKGFSPAAPS